MVGSLLQLGSDIQGTGYPDRETDTGLSELHDWPEP